MAAQSGVKRGEPWTKPMSREQRDAIALTRCEELLDKQANGKKRLSAATMMAIRIRYDKLRPALSSVDQTVHNAEDVLTQEQIDAKFQGFIDAHPEVLDRFLVMRAKANPLKSPDAAAQQPDEQASISISK